MKNRNKIKNFVLDVDGVMTMDSFIMIKMVNN